MSSTKPHSLPSSEWAKDYPQNEKLQVADSLDSTPERAKKEYELDGNPFGDYMKELERKKLEKKAKKK